MKQGNSGANRTFRRRWAPIDSRRKKTERKWQPGISRKRKSFIWVPWNRRNTQAHQSNHFIFPFRHDRLIIWEHLSGHWAKVRDIQPLHRRTPWSQKNVYLWCWLATKRDNDLSVLQIVPIFSFLGGWMKSPDLMQYGPIGQRGLFKHKIPRRSETVHINILNSFDRIISSVTCWKVCKFADRSHRNSRMGLPLSQALETMREQSGPANFRRIKIWGSLSDAKQRDAYSLPASFRMATH
jgi:hypothetical protein